MRWCIRSTVGQQIIWTWLLCINPSGRNTAADHTSNEVHTEFLVQPEFHEQTIELPSEQLRYFIPPQQPTQATTTSNQCATCTQGSVVWPCGPSNWDQIRIPLSINLCESLCITQWDDKPETERYWKRNQTVVTNERILRTWWLLSHHHRKRFSQSDMSNPPQRHLVLELGRPCQWAFHSAQVGLFQQPKSKTSKPKNTSSKRNKMRLWL